MIGKDDVFELDGTLYCVLDVVNYNGNEYCCCNQMENEKTFGATYKVFEIFDDGIEPVEDDDLLNNVLSPMFSNNVNIAMYKEDED